MASLRETQRAFAAALRDPAVTCAVLPPANLGVYRNSGSITFREALGLTFPVLRRRVGDDYFRQLSVHYRERFPSRSGDLHWAGRDFAVFLDDYLAGSEYQWLADLARIESAVASGQAASLPTLAPYLVHSDPALREAAREGMLQMSLAEAAPLLREAAGKIKDPREAILLLDAADFLSLPTIPVAAGAPRRTPVPPPPQRERPPPTASKSPLRP